MCTRLSLLYYHMYSEHILMEATAPNLLPSFQFPYFVIIPRFLRLQNKFFYEVSDTVFFIRFFGNVRSYLLNILKSVAHADTEFRKAYHALVVHTVAKAHGVCLRNFKTVRKPHKRLSLTAVCRKHFKEVRLACEHNRKRTKIFFKAD